MRKQANIWWTISFVISMLIYRSMCDLRGIGTFSWFCHYFAPTHHHVYSVWNILPSVVILHSFFNTESDTPIRIPTFEVFRSTSLRWQCPLCSDTECSLHLDGFFQINLSHFIHMVCFISQTTKIKLHLDGDAQLRHKPSYEKKTWKIKSLKKCRHSPWKCVFQVQVNR